MQQYGSRVHRTNQERMKHNPEGSSGGGAAGASKPWEVRQPSPQERSRRDRALEFAKRVPKPRIINHLGERPSQQQATAAAAAAAAGTAADVPRPGWRVEGDSDEDPLEALERRHREQQQAVHALLGTQEHGR